LENSDAIAPDTSSPAAVTTVVVGMAAADIAASIDERIPARSAAAAANKSGAVIRYDIEP
jgi:hypothetical protein